VELDSQNRRLQSDLQEAVQRRADAEDRAKGATAKLVIVGLVCVVIGAVTGFFVGSAPSRAEKKWRRMPI
jgi:hypothetical protein